jgi:hypothetical protein
LQLGLDSCPFFGGKVDPTIDSRETPLPIQGHLPASPHRDRRGFVFRRLKPSSHGNSVSLKKENHIEQAIVWGRRDRHGKGRTGESQIHDFHEKKVSYEGFPVNDHLVAPSFRVANE